MRKVIQNAEMTIETDKPSEGQQKIGVIAEKHGGFVVISESKHNDAASQNVASTLVNVVVRVPAQKFRRRSMRFAPWADASCTKSLQGRT